MTTTTGERSKWVVIVLAYIGFISLGLPDGLLGVAWPDMRAGFGVSLDSLGILLASGTIGYAFSSFNSGRLVNRMGVGRLLAVSCLLTGTSLLGYTLAPAWIFMVLIGFMAGMGAGAIDAGINTYVAANHSASLMYWLHASFGVGVTIGPLIMTAGLNLTNSWRTGYVVVGLAQLVLATCFFLTADHWQKPPAHDDEKHKRPASTGSTLRRPIVWLGVMLFVVYCGGEVIGGQWSYTLITESRGVGDVAAGFWVSAYWGAFTVGRLAAGFIARHFSVRAVMRAAMIGSMVGALLYLWNPSDVISLAGLALVGFSFAPIFPSLISTTAERVGEEHAANAIGFQVSGASFGIALLPGIAGFLAARVNIEMIAVSLLTITVVVFVLHEVALAAIQRQQRGSAQSR